MDVAMEVSRQLIHQGIYSHKKNGTTGPGGEAPDIPFGTVQWWIVCTLCFFLILFAAMMSGLTMAYMSLDSLNLHILEASGSVEEKTYAKAISPLLKNRHFLLVTLLVGNASAMEALPIFLDKLVPSYVAILLSVTFVLIFGEIIPQAVFTKYRLPIGARLAIFVYTLEGLMCWLCYPIAKILDFFLGADHPTIYRRCELKELTKQHAMNALGHGTLSEAEVRMMVGTLEVAEKQAKDAMQPISRVYMLSLEAPLDAATMTEMTARGHSRIPVYLKDPSHIVGVLIVKNLILVDPEDKVCVQDLSNMCIRHIARVEEDTPLFDVMRKFKQDRTHLALVCKQHGDGELTETDETVGVITMEDIMEELMGEEIEDETDGEGLQNVTMGIAQTYARNKALQRHAMRAHELSRHLQLNSTNYINAQRTRSAVLPRRMSFESAPSVASGLGVGSLSGRRSPIPGSFGRRLLGTEEDMNAL